MSIFRKMITYFSKQCETSEKNLDESLKTRYYRANLGTLFKSVEDIFALDPKTKIVSTSIDHGEIAVEVNRGRKMFLIITIITVRPYQTAIDVNASTDSSSLFGAYPSLKAEITRLYQELDKKHQLIGTGKLANQ